MQLLCFAVKTSRLFRELWLSRCNQSKEILCFFRFLNTPADRVSEILLRHPLVRFTVISSDTCATANELPDQPIVSWTAWNLLYELHNRFAKARCPLLQVERMPRGAIPVRVLMHTHPHDLSIRVSRTPRIFSRCLWSLNLGASLELGVWSLELFPVTLGAWSSELFHQPLANASDCFTKSSPLHSPSARTIFCAAASSAAALALALRSVCMRTSSRWVVK